MTPGRKAVEKCVIDTMNILDKTGANGNKYKEMFSTMTDSQFDKYIKDFFKNESENFYLEVETYVIDPKMKDIKEAADYLGVPLFEKVALPFATDDPSKGTVTTPVEVPVGYLHMKRVQQMVAKKNSMSIDINQRIAKFGQVSGSSKNARVSDSESIVLISQGLNNTLEEFLHPRADNLASKTEMLNKINTDGYVSLKDLPKQKSEKVALNTLDVYFTSAMVKTDLVTDGLLLKRTLQGNRDVTSVSGKYANK